MTDPFSAIAALGVVPVIAIGDASEAIALADALLEGGLPVAEITFRTPAAAETLAILRDARPELLIGAGRCSTSARSRLRSTPAPGSASRPVSTPKSSKRRKSEACLSPLAS